MKKLTTLFLVAFSSVMLAQIPGPCFATWSGGINNSPAGWESSNIIVANSASMSGTVHGSCVTSAALNSVLNGSSYYGGSLVTYDGTNHSIYFPTGGTQTALNGWYQLTSVSGDEFLASIVTKTAHNNANGAGAKIYSTSTAVWKQFSVCIVVDSSTMDSAAIYFNLDNSRGHDTTHNGSLLTIDDLSFGSCIATGIDEVNNNNVILEEAYPNPANGICNIIFSLPCSSTVNVSIYDLSGRKVLTPLENATLSDGRYKVPVDVTNLANGIYEYTLTVNGMPITQKLVVAK